MNTQRLTEMEQSVMLEALTEYSRFLRTTGNDGKVLTEQTFLASDISQGRRARYLATMGLKAEVAADHLLINCV